MINWETLPSHERNYLVEEVIFERPRSRCQSTEIWYNTDLALHECRRCQGAGNHAGFSEQDHLLLPPKMNYAGDLNAAIQIISWMAHLPTDDPRLQGFIVELDVVIGNPRRQGARGDRMTIETFYILFGWQPAAQIAQSICVAGLRACGQEVDWNGGPL